MTESYTFDCGCKFKILDPKIKEYDGLPSIEVDFDRIPLTCGKTWDLLCDADTKGIFQLEKSGQSWARQVKPRSIEELSDLISIIRPGVTQSKIEDKSLTNHYIDRKFKREETKYEEPTLEPILSNTHGILVYQEQAIRIARDIAGFSMEEADSLRKSIGKKDAQLMTKIEKMFLDGCKKTGIVNEESAKQIFGWIRESQKYSFNKCLHPYNIVETPEGFKTLKEIKIGDKVLAPKNENENEFVNVVNIYKNGEKDLYNFTTESGKIVTCTLDHKFLCDDGYLRTLQDIILNQHKIICNGIYFSQTREAVIEFQFFGFYETIDIEVDNKEHIFYVGGVCCSNSHGIGYAYNAYWNAYIKAHFPQIFYASWLSLASNKADESIEISDLVFDAKKHDVDVRRPSFKNLNFTIEKGGCRYGLTNIKDIGESCAKKIIARIETKEKEFGRPVSKWRWLEFLTSVYSLNSKAINNIIYVGMLDYMGLTRKRMHYEYTIYAMLKDKEIELAAKNAANHNTLIDLLRHMTYNDLVSAKRVDIFKDLIKSLENPSYDLKDTPEFIILKERELLSTALTFNSVDVASNAVADTTCKELNDGKQGGIITIEIVDCREHITKNGRSAGQPMAFIKGRDETYDVSVSVFAEMYKKYKQLLEVGNIINVYLKSNDRGHMATKITQA